jgi:hypothetical protein
VSQILGREAAMSERFIIITEMDDEAENQKKTSQQ